MDSGYLLYACLAGFSIYAAFLAVCGRRFQVYRVEAIVWNLALALVFTLLALGRAEVLGAVHGQFLVPTRIGFAVYGLTLVVIIGRYWLAAWRSRRRE